METGPQDYYISYYATHTASSPKRIKKESRVTTGDQTAVAEEDPPEVPAGAAAVIAGSRER